MRFLRFLKLFVSESFGGIISVGIVVLAMCITLALLALVGSISMMAGFDPVGNSAGLARQMVGDGFVIIAICTPVILLYIVARNFIRWVRGLWGKSNNS